VEHNHPSAQIPILISVLASGAILACCAFVLSTGVISSLPVGVVPAMQPVKPEEKEEEIPFCTEDQIPHAILTIGEEDSGGRYELRAGETAAVVLAANISTGYSWFTGYDEAALTLICRRVEEQEGNKLGQVSREIFYFRGENAVGQTNLSFSYRRPFEKDVHTRHDFYLDVI